MSFNLEEKLTRSEKNAPASSHKKNLVEYQLKHRKNVANYRKF